MKAIKLKPIIIGIAAIALVGAITLTLMSNKKKIDQQKEVISTTGRIAVSVAEVQLRDANSCLELVGVTEPEKEVVVAAECAGKIVAVNFEMGDHVNSGMLLAQVDDTYKRLAYETAQLNYNKMKDDYDRYQVLRSGDAVSETQLRDMKINYETASIQFENAKKQWNDTKIVAPFGGVIASKNIELGAYVNVSSVVASIADVAKLKVKLSVSESSVYQLSKGQSVKVSCSVFPGVEYKGTIANISPKGSSAHTFPVEVVIENNNAASLKAGTYVNVRVAIGKAEKLAMIPRDAIVSSVKDPSVYVVKNEKVQLVKINTGGNYNSFLEVTSGVALGDKVVINGQINLTDGAPVSIINNQQ